ncbi:hypothetical protein [Sandaracinus amylolyticus]|uniref:Uncharacterized protein n=1 Tax=Sandaracinus amylolyticus TaxID=927083 RepID=A0A0F6YKV5_9BACT|nr:hypothetical protein [Sandaracinus amylolyticus]AKF09132.1 hypothetical protein DB32_006281 [Sandaracinus amylolyticus]
MASTPSEKIDAASEPRPFASKLPEGRQRFLAHTIEHALACGRRTHADFLRHFPPAAIMHALQDHPDLRASIIEVATGVRFKIAVKKSAEACGVDLQIALDEGETQPNVVVQQLHPDDRVRYLDARALWRFLSEGAFWTTSAQKDRARHAIAAEHIAFMLDRALVDQLLTHRDIVEGITVTRLSELLPRTELEMLLAAALKVGSENKPFVEKTLLTITPITTLVRHIPLDWIWEQVVVPRIAEVHGLVPEATTMSPPVQPPPPLMIASASAPSSSETDIEVKVTMDEPEPAASAMDVEVDEILGSMGEPEGKSGVKSTSGPGTGRIAIPKPALKRG